jgi:DNA-binding MurR/RpiR family transcriptional regulator
MTTSLAPPRDFQELRERLIPMRAGLPKRLAQVATFAVEQPDEFAFGTVASIAILAGVQPSTLVRFAQMLGYDGFSAMQNVFRDRLRDRFPDYAERVETLRHANWDRGGAAGLFDGFAKAAGDSLARIQQNLDGALLENAVDVLAAAETVYLVGQRRAYPVTSYLAYALGKLAVRTALVDNVGSLASEQLAFARPRDALLAVSFTPYTPLTVELCARSAERGVPVVAVTDSPFSPIATHARAVLEVAEADFGGFRSLSATLCLAMTLAVGIAEKRQPGTAIPS